PAHILFHVEHAAFRFDVEAARIEAYALANQRDLGIPRIAPAEIDQSGRASGRAADRVDEWEVLGNEVLTDDRAQLSAAAIGQRARCLFQIRRTHVVGRRIGEVAREKDALDDTAEVFAIDVARQLQAQILFRLL